MIEDVKASELRAGDQIVVRVDQVLGPNEDGRTELVGVEVPSTLLPDQMVARVREADPDGESRVRVARAIWSVQEDYDEGAPSFDALHESAQDELLEQADRALAAALATRPTVPEETPTSKGD